jgi:hypothetical protein
VADTERFLSRWARLKQEAAKTPPEPQGAPAPSADRKAGGEAQRAPETALPASAPGASVESFDPSRLPALETIGADSDVTAFLARGVPAELTRAALRRVWTADPAVRDFVGLSENAWDFTAPDGVPGFGPMAPAEVRQAFTQLSTRALDPHPQPQAAAAAGQPGSALRESPPDAADAQELGAGPPQQVAHAVVKSGEEVADPMGIAGARQSEDVEHKGEPVAREKPSESNVLASTSAPRTHGRALPK